MRYPASEKLEIIRTVESSHLPVIQTLDMLCIPRSTFYRWYDLYVDGGLGALADHSLRPGSVWNRIPDSQACDVDSSLRCNNAMLCKMATYCVDRLGALADEHLSCPKQHGAGLLTLRLQRNEPHRWSRRRFDDGFGVSNIVLLPFYKWLHIVWCNQYAPYGRASQSRGPSNEL